MATNMIEIATLPINVPVAPTAAGFMVDPRTMQIVYNPDGTVRYLPAMLLPISTEKVTNSRPTKTAYQTATIKPNRLSAGHVIRLTHFGFCAANTNSKTVSIEFNGVVVATTGAVTNNGGAFRLVCDVIIATATTAAASSYATAAQTTTATWTDAIPLDPTQAIPITFSSINAAVGDTTHCGYIAELIG